MVAAGLACHTSIDSPGKEKKVQMGLERLLFTQRVKQDQHGISNSHPRSSQDNVEAEGPGERLHE